MSDLPDGLDPGRHAELQRRVYEPWARRAFVLILAAAIVAALAGAVGQRSHTSRAVGPGARLELRMPSIVRGGLLFQARIRVTALRTVEHPRLVLGDGLLDGLQVNTIEPGASSESSRGDSVVLAYDQTIPAGRTFTVYMQFQLDPTSVGRTRAAVSIADGTTTLASVHRSLRRLP